MAELVLLEMSNTADSAKARPNTENGAAVEKKVSSSAFQDDLPSHTAFGNDFPCTEQKVEASSNSERRAKRNFEDNCCSGGFDAECNITAVLENAGQTVQQRENFDNTFSNISYHAPRISGKAVSSTLDLETDCEKWGECISLSEIKVSFDALELGPEIPERPGDGRYGKVRRNAICELTDGAAAGRRQARITCKRFGVHEIKQEQDSGLFATSLHSPLRG